MVSAFRARQLAEVDLRRPIERVADGDELLVPRCHPVAVDGDEVAAGGRLALLVQPPDEQADGPAAVDFFPHSRIRLINR